MTASQHYTSLINGHSLFKSELGEVTRVNADELPILVSPSSGWCWNPIRSAPRIGMLTPASSPIAPRASCWFRCFASAFSCLEVGSGQMFHVESGALHAIENIGGGKAELIIAFRHQRPEDFALHAAFGAMTDPVLGNTYGVDQSVFADIARSTDAPYIIKREGKGAEAVIGPARQFA
jgi:oxalate decarboxylase